MSKCMELGDERLQNENKKQEREIVVIRCIVQVEYKINGKQLDYEIIQILGQYTHRRWKDERIWQENTVNKWA